VSPALGTTCLHGRTYKLSRPLLSVFSRGARSSFSRLFFCWLPKANAGAPAIFVDEFDAGVLESTPNDIEGGAARLGRSRLKLMDRHLAYTRGRCEILLAPFEKTPRCPAL
jgi:hypothetical protein